MAKRLEADILQGDSLTVLKSLASNPKEFCKYRLIVTSPPYFHQRTYGKSDKEIGNEKTLTKYLDNLVSIFDECKKLLADDGSLFIVIGDKRINGEKLLIPHKLAIKLSNIGYFVQEDIIWNKPNALSSSSKSSLTQSYEVILFLSKIPKPFLNMDAIRVPGAAVTRGSVKTPAPNEIQKFSTGKNTDEIKRINDIINNSPMGTPFKELPSTNEITAAYGFDGEKYCSSCHVKFKRHVSRRLRPGHKHYPVFAACNPLGKNPGNVWTISTKSHYDTLHPAIFPEDLVSRIIKFTTESNDNILDPFMGRGTVGIVSIYLDRNFTGIDLYSQNIKESQANIEAVFNFELPAMMMKRINES